MDSNDETVIELSKTKLLMLILGSCAFVAAGVWLLSLDPEAVRARSAFRFFFNDPWVARGLGLAAVVFFGICGVFGAKKIFDEKPGLVLNSSGLVDNASPAAAGFIPWSEVLGLGVLEIQKQKTLVVAVRDPEKYIDRGGALKRALNRANHKLTGSPVAISSVALKIDFSELVSLFNRYHRKYGGPSAARES